MSRVKGFPLWCLAAALLSSAAQAQSPKPPTPSAEPAGVMRIEAGDGRFLVIRSDKTVVDFAEVAEHRWNGIKRQLSPGQVATFQQSFSVLSRIGPWLGLEEETSCDCGGAHPSESKVLRTYDILESRSNKLAMVDLSDLFADQQVLDGLLANARVKQVLGPDEPTPGSSKELIKELEFKPITIGECSYEFDRDTLSDFIIDKIDSNTATVKVGLPAADEVCRGSATTIELHLPIDRGGRLSASLPRGNAPEAIAHEDAVADQTTTFTLQSK